MVSQAMNNNILTRCWTFNRYDFCSSTSFLMSCALFTFACVVILNESEREHFNCTVEKKTSLNCVIGKSDRSLCCTASAFKYVCFSFLQITFRCLFLFFSFLYFFSCKKTNFFTKLVLICVFLSACLKKPDRSSRNMFIRDIADGILFATVRWISSSIHQTEFFI